MAKYNITYSCGHEGTVQLFGKSEERERKIKYYEEFGLCAECYKKQKQEENAKLGFLIGGSVADTLSEKGDLPVLRRGYPSAQGRDQGTGIPVDSRGCQPDGLYAQAGHGMG